MNDFVEILNSFKKATSSDKVISVMGSKDLTDLILAWKSVGIKYLEQEACTFTTDYDRWNWLWTRIKFDKDELKIVSGLNIQDFDKVFTRAKALKLIYPDGTVDMYVSQYFSSVIIKTLGSPKKTVK